MNAYANSLKEKLTSLIREMAATPAPYVKNPEKDFTRKKKLIFETAMQLLISMGGSSSFHLRLFTLELNLMTLPLHGPFCLSLLRLSSNESQGNA